MRYVIVCLLKGEVIKFHEEVVSSVCEKFNLQRQKLPAHFTIKAPFEYNDISSLEQITEKFCSLNRKDSIVVEGFNHFRNNVVYMDIKPSKNTVNLIDDYLNQLKDLEWLEWKPNEKGKKILHCTIVSKKVEGSFNEVWNYVTNFKYSFDAYFDNIAIMVWKDGIWKIYKEYFLNQ